MQNFIILFFIIWKIVQDLDDYLQFTIHGYVLPALS